MDMFDCTKLIKVPYCIALTIHPHYLPRKVLVDWPPSLLLCAQLIWNSKKAFQETDIEHDNISMCTYYSQKLLPHKGLYWTLQWHSCHRLGGGGQAVNGGPLPSIPNCFVHTLKFYKPIYIQPYGKMSAWLCMLTCNFLLFCKSI